MSRPIIRRSWLVDDGSTRERMMDMERRLRPARMRTFGMVALVLLASAPWVGYWTVAPLAAGIAMFLLVERRIEGAERPEFWIFAAWAGSEVLIAVGVTVAIALHGAAALSLIVLLAIPVETLSLRFAPRAVWAGVGIAGCLMAAVAIGTNPDAVAGFPPVLFAPLAVLVALAMFSTVLAKSDLEHRGKAFTDPLTGLLNRASLAVRAQELYEQSRQVPVPVGMIALDIDGFKALNDSQGHMAGDDVLVKVADALRGRMRAFDLIYRLGGDEFLVLVPGSDAAEVSLLAVGVRAAVMDAFPSGELGLSCGASASAAGETFNVNEIFAEADAALYQAKAEGGGVVRAEGRTLLAVDVSDPLPASSVQLDVEGAAAPSRP